MWDFQETRSKYGMTVRWGFGDNIIYFEASAPTQGWVALGFNTVEALPGTNLIMGSTGRVTLIQDRFIVEEGVHQAKSELGADSRIIDPTVEQTKNQTTIRFALPVQADDAYSHTLTSGTNIHLLLAYSADRDFDHHSRMRIWLPVTL